MSNEHRQIAIQITAWPGQPSCAELDRLAMAGEQPRTDYVELARILDADVIDGHYITTQAAPLARMLGNRMGMVAGQMSEIFLHRDRYRHIFVWDERPGLLLALGFKLIRHRCDMVLQSADLSTPKRVIFLKRFKVYFQLRAINCESSMQMELAATRLGVPRDKLHLVLPGVDERFWHPDNQPTENLLCSVGSEARDYPTLIKAVRGLNMTVAVVAGGFSPVSTKGREILGADLPSNIQLSKRLSWLELRRLYSQSRFVVVPTQDVEFNAGITVVREAMAMGKPVIITKSRAQIDYIRDGEQGIYVPPGDPAALRAAIEYLASHPDEVERMGRAGRALIEERYTLDTFVTRLATIVLADEDRAPDVPETRRMVAS